MMSFLIHFSLCFFFFCSCAGAELQKYGEPQEVSATEGLPSGLVAGCVSAISGEYTDYAADIVLAGPEPLVVSRVYTSFCREKPWAFNHGELLILGDVLYKNAPSFIVALRQSSGAQLDYICKKTPGMDKLKEHTFKLIAPKGLMHGASSISGQTNLKNQKVFFNVQDDEIIAQSGGGDRKYFKRSGGRTEEGWPLCKQIAEEKANGSVIRYEGTGKGVIKAETIRCLSRKSGKEYSSIKLSEKRSGKDEVLQKMLTSDGREYAFYFHHHTYKVREKGKASERIYPVDRFYLTRVDHPYSPKEEYRYAPKASSKDLQLISKLRKGGKRFLEIDYYHAGINSVGGEVGDVSLKEKDDFRLDRVKRLKAPVGEGQAAIVTHRFDYHAEQKEGKVGRGYSDVFDAKNHKVRYKWDDEHRLTAIIRYSGKGRDSYAIYSKECFFWNDEGLLVAKVLKDSSDEILSAKTFEYDARGNVVRNALCGQLTGRPSPKLKIDPKGRLKENGYERDVKEFTYSDDGRNLLLSESDSSGKRIDYVYKKSSNHVAAKYLSYDGAIQLREFYAYDDNYALTEKIIDDGSHLDLHDLCDVTQRLKTRITPRKQAPVGLPKCVEEIAEDLIEKKELLLKRTHYQYSKEGWLTEQKVEDANGNAAFSLFWEHDAHGNVIAETSALGLRNEKSYDPETDELIEERTSGLAIKYRYDFAGRMIEKRTLFGEDKESTFNCYDTLGNCKAMVNSYGGKTRQSFDEFGRVIAMHYPEVPFQGELKTPTLTKTYDAAGFVTSESDACGHTTHIEVNSRGQPIRIAYPDGTQEEMIYSLSGFLMEKVSKNGMRTVYERDPMGRLLKESVYGGGEQKETSYEYSAFHLLATQNALGERTTYLYDPAGRVKEIRENGCKKEQAYDALGRLSEIKEFYSEERFRKIVKRYDCQDQLLEERIEDDQGSLLHASYYAYDERGQRILEQTGEEKKEIRYNAKEQPILIIDGLGHKTHISYDTQFINEYGQRVLQKKTTDPIGRQTIETFDAMGRVASLQLKTPFGEILSCERLFYDLSGRLIEKVEERIEQGQCQATLKTHLFYTLTGEIERITEAVGTPEEKTTAFIYNAQGQKEALLKPDGTKINYRYDGLGRLSECSSSDSSIHYLYTYDRLDRLTEVKDCLSGRCTRREYHQGNLCLEALANDLVMQYTHDRLGRVSQVLFPDGSSAEYCYSAVDLTAVKRIQEGRVRYVHENRAHSLAGHVTCIQPPGNNPQIENVFDPLGRCIEIKSESLHQQIPQEGLDAVGNLLKYCLNGVEHHFAYDPYYHLRLEKGHNYSYDSLSNRTSKDGLKCRYNALNQLLEQGDESCEYDANGYLVRKGKTQYRYDALGRLIFVQTAQGNISYTYDSFNRRLSKTMQGEEERFLYQGLDEVGCWKNGQCQTLRLLGKDARSRTLAIEIEGATFVPYHDISGNIVMLRTLENSLVEEYRYSVFGERQIFSASGEELACSAIQNPWQYSGKRIDEETGFVSFGMRYYAPHLGRWITPDPAGFTDGSNLYLYVYNNPLQYIDEYGLTAVGVSSNSPPPLIAQSTCFFEAINSMRTAFAYNQHCNHLRSGSHFEEGGFDIQHVAIEDSLEKLYTPPSQSDPQKFTFHRSSCYSANDFINPETGLNYTFKALPQNKSIIFINGIMNGFEDFRESLLYLSEITGYNVEGIFCPSHGFCIDALSYQHAFFDGYTYEGTRILQERIMEFHQNQLPGATMLVQPHSRGVVDTRNGLIDLPPECRERVDVCAIAPGAYIDKKYCNSVVHYTSPRDAVPLIDRQGRNRCRDTIVTLNPHPDAAWFDHSFTSPTYRDAIKTEIRNYIHK